MRGATKIVVKLLSIVTVFSILFFTPSGINVKAEDTLEEQLRQLEEELNGIKEKQRKLQAEISETQEEQTYLQSQINSYNNSITQTELIIQATEKQIEVYNKEIELLAQQVESTEKMIVATSKEIGKKRENLKDISFNIYQNNQISTLDLVLSGRSVDESLYWTHFLNLSKEEGQEIIDALENLHAQQEAAKAELEAKKTESEQVREELKAETKALAEQVSGLSWQKSERQGLLAVSEEEESVLAEQKAEMEKKAREIERQMQAIEYQLISRVPSGAPIAAGSAFSQFGRTGYVLTSLLGGGWRYPHPIQYPKHGSHIHFVLFINGQRVNPGSYIGKNGFGHPFPGAIITRGYSSGHPALDYAYSSPDATWGKPVYAPAAGVVEYGTYYFDCDEYPSSNPPCSPGGPFPRHDWHYAVIYHTGEFDGWISQYWHIRAK